MASALDTARTDIESYVSSTWTATAIQWSDRPFTQPSTPWLRVTILFGEAYPFTMGGAGNSRNEIVGLVQCDVFAIEGKGLGSAVQYADDARTMLNQTTAGSVRLQVASGPVEVQGGRKDITQLSVTCPFRIEESV